MQVRAVLTELALEAIGTCVLRQLSGLNEVQLHLSITRPCRLSRLASISTYSCNSGVGVHDFEVNVSVKYRWAFTPVDIARLFDVPFKGAGSVPINGLAPTWSASA
jgi:hypothetical protein